MLEIRDLTKEYGIFPAVDHVSFSVAPGEVLGYLGPNGAGKTTTIKMLAGLVEPTGGRILFDGREVKSDDTDFKRRIGYVPEQSEIYPHLSGYDYLLLVGRLRDIPERALRDQALAFLRIFDLENDMHGSIGSYSKGMRQKVLISAALMHDPDILLFDEPLSGLDVTSSMVVRDLIARLRQAGKIVIYSSHVLEVTEKICTKVIILDKGRIVANDSAANLESLMRLPSLVEVFSRLVSQEDPDAQAKKIMEAMRG